MDLFWSLLPIAVILLMLILWRKPADISGIVGWVVVCLAAVFAFNTSWEVVFRSTASGLIKSFGVSLAVGASLLQMAYMERTGALKRIIIFIKSISVTNRAVQVMLINVGLSTLMVSVGATPGSLFPPILVAMGYSTFAAIAIPSIGYDSLCTYALMGVPIVVFYDVINKGAATPIPMHEIGMTFWYFLPVVSFLIGLGMLWLLGKGKAIQQGILPAVLVAVVVGVVSYFTNSVDNLVTLTGIFVGIAVILVMAVYLKLSTGKTFDNSNLSGEELQCASQLSLWKALSPWMLLVASVLILNVPPSWHNWLFGDMAMAINGLTPDGSPIKTRALWNPYTWIIISTLLSFIIIRPTGQQLKETWRTFLRRAPRPMFSAAIFFAIADVMAYSRYDMLHPAKTWNSMIKVMADWSADTFQHAYAGVTSFIGLLGGFITGSEASTIQMFGHYSALTADKLHLPIVAIMAGLAFGGGLASVISPAKLQNAAASIDKLGEENAVIRVAFVLSILLTIAASIVTVVISNFMQ